jgi:hypothetical protein
VPSVSPVTDHSNPLSLPASLPLHHPAQQNSQTHNIPNANERRRKLCLHRITLSAATLHTPRQPARSVDKVDAEKVQQQRPEDEVGKGALVRDALELDLVLRVRLHAQAGREHKLADGGAEAREEGVEGLWGGMLVQCSVFSVQYVYVYVCI